MKDIAICYAKCAYSFLFEEPASAHIRSDSSNVIVAVKFDGQSKAGTVKVEHVWPDGMLPPKCRSELPASQSVPQFLLDRRHAPAVITGTRRHSSRTAEPG